MKKALSLLLVLIMIIFSANITTFAEIGDVKGYAKYTDISAFINYYPITSYNINDYTVVVAEDLRNYGFNVVWDGDTRSLSITKNDDATDITPAGKIYKYSSRAGENSFPYLETDIATYVNGAKVDSFNINGSTCIYIDSLAVYGRLEWNSDIRAIEMWIEGLPAAEYAPLEEAITMYAADGRTILISEGEKESYKSVGWYEYPVTTMYAPDGRKQVVAAFDVEANKAVGWYDYPVTEITVAGGKTKVAAVDVAAYKAYEKILNDSMAGVMNDKDFYNMYTDLVHKNAQVESTLYAYLLDITGDGKEELFLKEDTYVESDAMLDVSTCDEWIRVFTYTDSGVKRIGQSLTWAKVAGTSKYGGNSYSYYEPAGYIGSILSSVEFPYISDDCLYYCLGTDGRQYLADYMPKYTYEENKISFYAYNGNLMEKVCTAEASFVHSWYVNSHIKSSNGSYLYKINGENVSEETYRQCLNKYWGGGSYKLANNDCNQILNKLKNFTN